MRPIGSRKIYVGVSVLSGLIAVTFLTWWLIARGTRGAEIASDVAAGVALVTPAAAFWPKQANSETVPEGSLLAGSTSLAEAKQNRLPRSGRIAFAESARLPQRRVALWGPAASGKTCLLASLNTAIVRESPPRWSLIGANNASTELLVRLTECMVGDRRFPGSTENFDFINWIMKAESEGSAAARAHGRSVTSRRQFAVDIIDASGEMYRPEGAEHADFKDLLNNLISCDGLILCIDPIWESIIPGLTNDSMWRTLSHLQARLDQSDGLVGGRLPHRAAVCITKFDEAQVLNAARRGNHLELAPDNRLKLPWIAPGASSERFFQQLCGESSTGRLTL